MTAAGATIEVVDKTGKVWTSGSAIFQALKDAKSAYHARKTEILAERATQRAKEAAKLVALENEARSAERRRKRLEHQKRSDERKRIKENEERKVMEGSNSEKDKENKRKEKKDKPRSKGLFGISNQKLEKDKKEKREEKLKDKREQSSSTTLPIDDPPTPPAGNDYEFVDDHGHSLTPKTYIPSSTQIVSSTPAIEPTALQILGAAPQILAMVDPNGNSPLSTLLLQLTDILDTLDCLNTSFATLMAVLEKNPQVLATVGLLFAETSAIVAKTTPAVVIAAKNTFPFIFSLLANPQFFAMAGAGVIILGGYKIVKKIAGRKDGDLKAHDDDEDLAYGSFVDDSEVEEAPAPRAQGPRRTMTMPCPCTSFKASSHIEVVSTEHLPPTPPKTPSVEAQDTDEMKDTKSGKLKRQALKRFFTTVN